MEDQQRREGFRTLFEIFCIFSFSVPLRLLDMKKLFTIALTISVYLLAGAQDSLRSVHYENLKQVSFLHLKKIDSAELKGVKFFYGASSDLFFECLIPVTQDSSIINQKEFDRSLQIFIEGFSSS